MCWCSSKIKLVLLLGTILDPLKICSPWAFSRKTQILSATFLISRPRETPQDCKETLMFSMPFKPLCLKNSPFFFWKFCWDLPLVSHNSQARAAIGHGRKTESNAGGFRTHFGTWIYSRFFFFWKNAIFWSLRSSCGRDFTPGLMQYFGVSERREFWKVAIRICDFCEKPQEL